MLHISTAKKETRICDRILQLFFCVSMQDHHYIKGLHNWPSYTRVEGQPTLDTSSSDSLPCIQGPFVCEVFQFRCYPVSTSPGWALWEFRLRPGCDYDSGPTWPMTSNHGSFRHWMIPESSISSPGISMMVNGCRKILFRWSDNVIDPGIARLGESWNRRYLFWYVAMDSFLDSD